MNNFFFIVYKIQFNIKEHGIAYLIRKFFDKLWKEITKGRQFLFSINSENISSGTIGMNKDLDIETFRSRNDIPNECMEDLKQFVRKNHMNEKTCNYYLDKLLEIFQNGGEITVGRIDGKIVGFLWKIHSHDNYQCHFNLFPLLPNDGLVFAGYALPAYRGINVIPTLIRYNSQLLKKEGVKRVFATCKEWNYSSRRCILKAGLNQIALARPLKIFGKQFVIWH